MVYYATKAALPELVKIGFARDDRVEQRVKEQKMTLLATEPGDQEYERHLHSLFAVNRAKGGRCVEFFYWTPELRERVESLRQQPVSL